MLTDTMSQNKPNGQFMLEFEPGKIKAFMHDLSIRKVPGIGRVGERLLESMGVKVIVKHSLSKGKRLTLVSDLWRYLYPTGSSPPYGQRGPSSS